MHQFKLVKRTLAHPISFVRVFLLCFLLVGSQLSVFASFSATANAVGYAHGKNGSIHSVATSHSGVSAATSHNGKTKPYGVKRNFADDLSISLAQSPASFVVGTPGTITASIVSASTATSEADAPSATITLPAGFTSISAASNPVGGWTFVVTGQVVTATYVGTLPIAPATTLPDIVVTTTATVAAVNLSTVTGTVTDVADANPADNTATLQVVITPPPPAIDAAISNTAPNTSYVIGSTVTYTIIVSTTTLSGSIGGSSRVSTRAPSGQIADSSRVSTRASSGQIANSLINITDLLPVGLTSVTVNGGSTWTVNSTATTSPSLITASYIGSYPIAPGTNLPAVTVTGVVDVSAGTTYTSTASVAVQGDSNNTNNTSAYTFNVVTPTPMPTATSTPMPTVTSTPTAPIPYLTISNTNTGGNILQVGQNISYAVVVSNGVNAGPVTASNPITVSDVLPVGLNNIVATAGPDWTITLNATPGLAARTTGLAKMAGSTTLLATYIGSYPVLGGTTLPTITITATLTAAAGSSLTSTASVNTNVNGNENNTSASTITVISAIPTPTLSPDVAITITHDGGTYFKQDHKIMYQLNVQNVITAGPVVTPGSISVTYVIPVGLRYIQAIGQNWNSSISSGTSPALLTATYAGPYPILPGEILPVITVIGTLTQDAIPSLTTAAIAKMQGDSNLADNIAVDTVFVSEQNNQCSDCKQNHDDQSNKQDPNKDRRNRDNNNHNSNTNDGQSSNNNNDNNGQSSNNNNGNNGQSHVYPTLPDAGGSPDPHTGIVNVR